MASAVSALQSPEYYGDNQCELMAKEFQKEFGGSLIWIQPLQPNGAFLMGEYSAHIINRAYSPDIGIYYFDWKTQTIMDSLQDVEQWYRLYSGNKQMRIYDLSRERPEFAMIWHY